MDGEQRDVNNAMKDLGKEFNPEFVAKYTSILQSMTDGVSPKEALGFSDERMELMYAQAYRLFNTGKFLEADHIFRLLMVLDPSEYKYYHGLAACLHMVKEYENAAKVYITASIIDPTNPVPNFHASDCYIQMRDRPSALMMLELAVQRAGDKPEYKVLKERALLTIDSLKKELQEQFGAQTVKE